MVTSRTAPGGDVGEHDWVQNGTGEECGTGLVIVTQKWMGIRLEHRISIVRKERKGKLKSKRRRRGDMTERKTEAGHSRGRAELENTDINSKLE